MQVTNIPNGIEGRKFQVAGHTDNKPIKSGKFRDNWELSAQRALTVTDLMIKTGLDARRLSAAGYADVLPVATNDTDDGRRQNRRIEIVLVPNLEDLPSINDKNQEGVLQINPRRDPEVGAAADLVFRRPDEKMSPRSRGPSRAAQPG